MIKILLEFTDIFQKTDSLDETFNSLNSLLKKKFDFKFTAIYISDIAGKFVIDKLTNNSLFQEEINKKDDLVAIFKDRKTKHLEKDFNLVFCKSNLIQSVFLVPLISKDYLFGIIVLAMDKKYDFSNDIDILTYLGKLLSTFLCSAIKFDRLRKHNKYLQEISSKVRHDLRNHLQIIGLSHDILLDTKVTDEQKGYLEKIGKGLAKASNLITEQISLKSKFNEDLEVPFGVRLT